MHYRFEVLFEVVFPLELVVGLIALQLQGYEMLQGAGAGLGGVGSL